jgi:hypothetical protein
MAHTELDLRERRAIEDMLNAKMPVSKIAAEIGRHRSTVYREIKRNYFNDEELPYLNGYYGMNAQKYASDRRARKRKLIRLDDLRSDLPPAGPSLMTRVCGFDFGSRRFRVWQARQARSPQIAQAPAALALAFCSPAKSAA